MSIKLKISVIPICCFLISCTSLDRRFVGNWVVDKVYLYDDPAIWNLYGNGFTLNDDHTCKLPIWNWDDRHSKKEEGEWKAFKKNDSIFIEIETENELFDRSFLVQNLRSELDLESKGYLTKMTLIADSVKIDCTGVVKSQ